MRSRWILLIVMISIISPFAGCRKNNTSTQVNVPGLPDGADNPDQPEVYEQVPVHLRIGDNVGGYYVVLPPSYNDGSNRKYPLLIFLHGGGELGDGSATMLPLLLKNAVPQRLHAKTLPASFTVDGESFSFIHINPQFENWPNEEDIHDVMKHSLATYRVDSSRIYMSGLSMGGGEVWEYAGSKHGNLLAAIVPICGATWADSAVARQIARNEVPAWAFHNEDDEAVTINSTKRYARLINAENPKYPVRVTYWPTGGHDAWTKASDPEYREDGKNMYEWMLQFSR